MSRRIERRNAELIRRAIVLRSKGFSKSAIAKRLAGGKVKQEFAEAGLLASPSEDRISKIVTPALRLIRHTSRCS
jgi:hypothetical protein